MKMDTEEETVFVVVLKGEPHVPFEVLGAYDNRDSAEMAYAERSTFNEFNFGVFELSVESRFTDALEGWKNQKENETIEEWSQRMENQQMGETYEEYVERVEEND